MLRIHLWKPGELEFLFIAITPKTTLTESGSFYGHYSYSVEIVDAM